MSEKLTVEGMQCEFFPEDEQIVLRVLLSNGSVRACHWPLSEYMTHSAEISPPDEWVRVPPPADFEEWTLVAPDDIEDFLAQSGLSEVEKEKIRQETSGARPSDVTLQ